MNKSRWKAFVFLVGIALLGLGTTGHYGGPTSQVLIARAQTPAAPAVTNNTTAVEVISLRQVHPVGYELVMRNASNKNINAYSVGFDGEASVTSDLTSTYKPIIAPGEQFKQPLPVTATITIRYVVFDDNSIDGDALVAAQLQQRRLGIQKQLRNIVNLINKEGPNADVERLKVDIMQLSEQDSGSVYVAAGMRNAKEDVLLALQKLDNNNKSAGLTRLLKESNSRLSRLSAKL